MRFPRKTYEGPGGCLTCRLMAPRGNRELEPPTLQTGKWGLTYGGEVWRASRLAFHLNVRPIHRQPVSLKVGLVLHTCDQDWCIDPDHLYLGTSSRNMQDKFERHPTIGQIMSDAGHQVWDAKSPNEKAAAVAPMLAAPPYERTAESRQHSADMRKKNWEGLTPEQYQQRCRNISEGRRAAQRKTKP